MKWLNWLGSGRTPAVAVEKQAIQSSHELLQYFLGGAPESAAGVTVTPAKAMRHAAVYACVYILAESVAQLPLLLYRRLDRGKERAPGHPLYSLLHRRPNSWQTSFEYREQAMRHLLLRGNHYGYINRDGEGRVRELIPLHPDTVTVEQRSDFSLRYRVRRADGGGEVTYAQDKVFHVRARSDDGIVGVSPIREARETFGAAIAAEDFGSRLFKNRAVPGGVLTHPGELGLDKQRQLKEEWDSGFGGENAYRTAVLHSGLEWKALAMTNDDAQFIETMQLKKRDIAAIFRVPPYKLGDVEQQPKANVEQQALEFVNESLLPWFVRFEQAIARDLIADDDEHFAEFLVSGLLRGDIKTRYEAYKTALMFGLLSPNEVREIENLNPREGGDDYMMPLNLSVSGDDVGGLANDVTARGRTLPEGNVTPLRRSEG